MNKQITKDFWSDEFECKCGCGVSKYEKAFVDELQKIRSKAGHPFIITSGFRCQNNHINIYKNIFGDEWKNKITWGSAHLLGRGADFYSPGLSLTQLWFFCEKHGEFNGLGSYPEETTQVIHGDILSRISRWCRRDKTYWYLF